MSNAGPYAGGGLDFAWDEAVDTGAIQTLYGVASAGAIDVEAWVDLAWDRDVLWLTLRLTAVVAVADIAVTRTVDFDTDATFDDYSTHNGVTGDAVWAASSYSDKAAALAADGGFGAICWGWCTSASEVRAGSTSEGTADNVLGVTVDVGDLDAGASVDVVFALRVRDGRLRCGRSRHPGRHRPRPRSRWQRVARRLRRPRTPGPRRASTSGRTASTTTATAPSTRTRRSPTTTATG